MRRSNLLKLLQFIAKILPLVPIFTKTTNNYSYLAKTNANRMPLEALIDIKERQMSKESPFSSTLGSNYYFS